ncbi:MAG: hypothetical protein ACRDAM_21735 [Casimicrobium sp.]
MAEKRYGDARHNFAVGLYKNPTYGAMDVCYIYTEAEHKEVQKMRALYRVLRRPVAPEDAMGALGKALDRSIALDAIDGGQYNPKTGGKDVN